jgi:hypothetical protein
MPVASRVYAVFGHFQNLNLLALLHDLREGRTARQAWLSGSLLCPVAHGLSQGAQVRVLRALGQAADLSESCDFAARHLGADPGAVLRFVRSWDEEGLSSGWLLRQLEEVWEERLADAEATQELLQEGPSAPEEDGQESERGGVPEFRPSLGAASAGVEGGQCMCEEGSDALAQ